MKKAYAVVPVCSCLFNWNNLYHLKCFRCSVCSESFVVGERFRLHDNQILCESDWRELRLFSQAAYNDRSLNQIARNLREMPDFQPVGGLTSVE
ncbi:LIM domain protein, partial [Ancylostoma duodenale]